MTWVKIDDQLTEHPKCIGLSPQAWTLWLHGLTYSSRNLTDGMVPKAFVPRLSSVPRPSSACSELVLAGLWVEEDDHYLIHDYTDHQRSAAQVKAEREATRRRVAKHRASKEGTV